MSAAATSMERTAAAATRFDWRAESVLPSASVLICGYSDERRELLRAALNSAIDQTVAAREIITVIDRNPALLALLAAEYPNVRFLSNTGPQGTAGARNTAARAATGDVLVFLDDDAIAPRDWLEKMLARYDRDVFAVGGSAHPRWPQARPRWLPGEFDWVVGCSYTGQPTSVADVRNVLGCNMSMRRDMFEALGGFREKIGRSGNDGGGCEETELCIRARQRFPNARIIYDPKNPVRHFVDAGRTRWSYFRARCLAEGRSKGRVVDSVGTGDGLKAERGYVTRTLPLGVLRNLGDAFGKLDFAGFARAGTIVAGLALTTWGYLGEKRRAPAPPAGFRPVKVVDLDINALPDELPARHPHTGEPYGGYYCLVRDGRQPLDVIEIGADTAPVTASSLRGLLPADGSRPIPLRPAGAAAHHATPAITVVVATRDRPDSLAVCLDSLLKQDYPRFDIVVVDSAPATRATADMIAARYVQDGRVRYVHAQRPGLGRAHNRGLEGVTAPVVAFTDDDVIVDSGWLSAIARNFADPAVGCVTGLILPAELETRAQLWTERHGGFGKGFVRRAYDLRDNRPAGPLFPFTAGQFGSGANMAFRTDTLRKAGGFDAALGAGTTARSGDDLAAFFAVVNGGSRLVYEPAAIVWHHHRRDEAGMTRQAFGYGVGLGAYLTRILIEDPRRIFALARAMPAGVAHMWGAKSPRMQRLPVDYPANLVWRERLGVLAGVPLYMRSRLEARRADAEDGKATVGMPRERSGAA